MPRPHLIERLNAGLHRKLTLVSTPAGFGKTTLASEWYQVISWYPDAVHHSPAAGDEERAGAQLRFWLMELTAA